MNSVVDLTLVGAELVGDFRRGNLGVEIIETGHGWVHLRRWNVMECRCHVGAGRYDTRRMRCRPIDLRTARVNPAVRSAVTRRRPENVPAIRRPSRPRA